MTTRPALPRVSILVCALAAAGCATGPWAPTPTAAPTIVPHRALHTVGAGPDASYATGKLRLADGDAAAALAAFDDAVRLDPAHVDARNGRATALARLGRTDAAIEELRRAVEGAPQAAHLLNNLGYLLLNRGRYDEAAEALRRAIAADPANPRYGANWAALTRRAPGVVTAAAPAATDPAATPSPQRNVSSEWSGPVLTLSWGSPPPPDPARADSPPAAVTVGVAPVRSPEPAHALPTPALRLEVSNGAGTPRLAGRTAASLRGAGVPVARVTNHRDFRQASTWIEYRDGHREAAAHLQSRLGLPEHALVPSDRLGPGVDARLVLGRDASAGLAVDPRPLAHSPSNHQAGPVPEWQPAVDPTALRPSSGSATTDATAAAAIAGQPAQVGGGTATRDDPAVAGPAGRRQAAGDAEARGARVPGDYLEPLRAELRQLRRLLGLAGA